MIFTIKHLVTAGRENIFCFDFSPQLKLIAKTLNIEFKDIIFMFLSVYILYSSLLDLIVLFE